MFAKIFTQIFDSSIAENCRTRHVFEDLLKLADVSGVVDMTPEAIARRTNVPIDEIRSALTELSKPDIRSRSHEEDGRRIVLIDSHRDWGWKITNYQHYREIQDGEALRAAWRDYQGRRRAKIARKSGKKPRRINTGDDGQRPGPAWLSAEAAAVTQFERDGSGPAAP